MNDTTTTTAAPVTTTEIKPAATTEAAATAATTTTDPVREQTVPLSRFQAVIAQKNEEQRAREALARELKLANDTLEEFRKLGRAAPGTGDAQAGDTRAATDPTTTPVRTSSAKAISPEELQRLVREEGARVATEQSFNARCNEAVSTGRAAHSDFDKVVLQDLTSISPTFDQRTGRPVLPTPFIEAALETGNAPEVLYALGQDANEATRIMSLSPIKQAIEVAKFASKLEAKKEEEPDKQVSKAPAPITPRAGARRATPAFTEYDTDNFSTEEWIKQREKKVREERAAARR